VNPFYIAGIVLIGAGAGFIYAAGLRDGMKQDEAEKWADANHSDMGTMDDVSRIRHRHDSSSDSA